MKKFPILALLFAFGLLTFTACDKDEEDPTPEEQNIVQLAQDTDDLSTLVSALQQADLVTTLEMDGPYTVFAPTNAAFQNLLDSNNDWNSLSDIDNATLTQVLLFHVVSGTVMADDLTDTYVATSATGPNSEAVSLKVDVTGGVMFNGSAKPTTTDVSASNGVVHIIDEVMLPPSVVDLAVDNSLFTSLVAALTRSDHTTDYVSILTGEGPFTVFAPTNDAFQALLDSNNDWDSLEDIPLATLEAVLNYHVVSGANVQADELTDGQTVTTLGGDFMIDLSSGAMINTATQNVNIIVTDVQGANGVVHVVDAVLLP